MHPLVIHLQSSITIIYVNTKKFLNLIALITLVGLKFLLGDKILSLG